jgi:hypothetical protein
MHYTIHEHLISIEEVFEIYTFKNNGGSNKRVDKETLQEGTYRGYKTLEKDGRIYYCDFGEGILAKCYSDRFDVFMESLKCANCGIEGKYFAKTVTSKDTAHLNLYGIKDGEPVLITKDHIIPKSKGGKNNIENYQTMCLHRNIKKGNNYEKD